MQMRTVHRWLTAKCRKHWNAGVAVTAGIAMLALATASLVAADQFDPFHAVAASEEDPFDEYSVAAPLDESAYYPQEQTAAAQPISYQIVRQPAATPPESAPTTTQPAGTSPAPPPEDPCAAATEKPLSALGISIALPSGNLPADHALACWDSLNQSLGPMAAARYWQGQLYHWDATALCHRPLYFEEINLERYGYGCCACLQPAASAAHFFGTVPALPYCMAADCPCECIYTLGHYRPGSCPPWRCHWPPCDPLAAAAEGGFMTGMIFLIP